MEHFERKKVKCPNGWPAIKRHDHIPARSVDVNAFSSSPRERSRISLVFLEGGEFDDKPFSNRKLQYGVSRLSALFQLQMYFLFLLCKDLLFVTIKGVAFQTNTSAIL